MKEIPTPHFLKENRHETDQPLDLGGAGGFCLKCSGRCLCPRAVRPRPGGRSRCVRAGALCECVHTTEFSAVLHHAVGGHCAARLRAATAAPAAATAAAVAATAPNTATTATAGRGDPERAEEGARDPKRTRLNSRH